MKRCLTATAVALTLAGTAGAQTPRAPAAPQPIPQRPSPAPGGAAVPLPPAPRPKAAATAAEFRRAAAASDAFEVEASRLALQRSRNPAVRRFAQIMIRDHGLRSGSATPGGGSRPAAGAPALDPRHAAMLNQLAATRGRDFDRAYARLQVVAHDEAVASFAAFAQGGEDAAVRDLAAKALPGLRHHLGMAQRLLGHRG